MFDRFGKSIGMPRPGIVRVAGVDCELTQLQNLIERRDAFGALLHALKAVRAIPDAAWLAELAQTLVRVRVARVSNIPVRLRERLRPEKIRIDGERLAVH